MRPIRPFLAALVAALALPTAAQAGTLSVQSGVVSYTESDTNATNSVTITLSTDGSRINFSDAGRSGGRALTLKTDGTCTVSRATGSCPAAGVVSIAVSTTDQNDTVTQKTSIPSRLDGGAGNDKLTGGGGNDVLIGGAGADTLGGGDGQDTADYSDRTAPLTITVDGKAGDGEQGENDNVGADVEVVNGGAGDDSISGGDGDNLLNGNGGNDVMGGGAGNDQLNGGDGADGLGGGDGNDALSGGPGDDTLTGGGGADVISGDDGNDTTTYATAPAGVTVTLNGKPDDGGSGEGDNVDTENLIGGPGDDVLVGNALPNGLAGGDGNDRMLGGTGADALDGGPGDDILQTLDGTKDVVNCGDGEDGVVSDRADVRTACDYIKYRPLAASSTALHQSKGYVRAPVRCSPATALGCRGRITLKSGRRTLGTLTYKLTAGRRWVARIKLTRGGLRTVKRHRVTTASLVVRDVDASGAAVRTTQTLRIAR